jgi:hypothetical protein
MILKLLGGILIASVISVFCWVFSLFLCKLIVDLFKLNYEQDAYWVFTVAFYAAILSWILSFFLTTTIIINR